jgi:hypothetical protein
MRASVASDSPSHCAREPGKRNGRPVALQIDAYTASVVPRFIALPTAMPMTVWGRCTVQVKRSRAAAAYTSSSCA